MSLSLFPPRDTRPPPPPKRMPSLPQLNCDTDAGKDNSLMSYPKKPSHNRMNSAPERVPAPLGYENSPSVVAVNDESSMTSFSKSFTRFGSAKRRAKDVWLSRRNYKGSVDLDTMGRIQEGFIDSPTIPGRPPATQQEQPASVDDCDFVQTSPNSDMSVSPLSDVKKNAKPLMPSELPPSPTTPWPTSDDEERRPEVPPKSAPLMRKGPSSPEKKSPTKSNDDEKPRAHRARAGSAPSSSPCLGTRVRVVRHGATPTHSSAEQHKNGQEAFLPHGVRPAQAAAQLAYADMRTLQHNARMQSEGFDILSPGDWSSLSRELSQLDSRCRYLRETRQSLRRGRKTLHTRILSNLRVARSATFSQDSLLKQQEALAELDTAIDDWESKLEDAEERRSQVKQKLLEHVAATLSVQTVMQSPIDPSIITPPATPEKQRRQRQDKESITVYALLADIKQEIERTAIDITSH